MIEKRLIAIDADGVLLDYSAAYAKAWERAFGTSPAEVDPLAYWPIDRWGVNRLAGQDLDRFRSCFDEQFWSTIPALHGALDGCHALHDNGHRLVCVSAIDSAFEQARLRNLRALGFPIERVVATGATDMAVSPKANALRGLAPVAFVDDFLPYFRGLPAGIHAALILRQPNGSPNAGPELDSIHSVHNDLADFAHWWLRREER